MRWWVAALLAVVCVVIGLLIPIPKLEYNGAFIPTEVTEPPLANIGLAERAPQPQQTLEDDAQDDSNYLFDGALNRGFSDTRAEKLPVALDALAASQEYAGMLIDLTQKKWMRINGYTLSRAGCPLALLMESDGQVAIMDIATQTKLHTLNPADLCEAPALLDWDQTANGLVAIAIADAQGQNGAIRVYDVLTGDTWTLTGYDTPRFALEGGQLYARKIEEDAHSLQAIALSPAGENDENEFTSQESDVVSFQPVLGGLLVYGIAGEESAPFLTLIDAQGEELLRYPLPEGASAQATLHRMEPGLAWLQHEGIAYLVQVDPPSLVEIGQQGTPIGLDAEQDRLLVRNGEQYGLLDMGLRQIEEIQLIY